MQDHQCPTHSLVLLGSPQLRHILVWISRHFLESTLLISQLMLVLCNPESIVRSLPPCHPLFFLPFSFFLGIYGSCPLACIRSLLVHSLCLAFRVIHVLELVDGFLQGAYSHKILRGRIFFEICYACLLLLLFSDFLFFFSFINFGCVVSVGHLHIYNYTICQYVHEVSSVVPLSCCNETLIVIKTFSFSSVIF